MKKKLLLLLIRIIRLFKAEDKFMPNLRSVPERQVRTGQLYRYYGRILVSRPWQGAVVRYQERTPDGQHWQDCSEIRYHELLEFCGKESVSCTIDNLPCSRCACQALGLPCRCDFTSGTFTGYYQLVHQDTQYSDNVTL